MVSAGRCEPGRKSEAQQRRKTTSSSDFCLQDTLHTAILPSQPSSFGFSFKMFRSAVSRSLRATSLPRVVRTSPGFRQLPRSSPIARRAQFLPCVSCQAARSYSAPAGLGKPEVEGRVVELLKNFDKVCLSVWVDYLFLLRLRLPL